MKYNKNPMYYSSKTEEYDQQNLQPNEFYEHPTINRGIFVTDLALSKALDNISQLQQNLAFMLELNQELRLENEKLKTNSEKVSQYVKNEQAACDKQMRKMQQEHEQVIELLQTTKRTLLDTEQELAESKTQIQRCNRIILEQKKAYEQLQQNYMNQSLSYVGDTSSINITKADLHYINELQKENQDLNIQLRRQQQQLEKNQIKMAKLEKQNMEFKKWMASVLGLQKVVDGTEKILMNQISQRMISG